MQITRIQDLESLLPRNRCYVAGSNSSEEDVRVKFTASRPTHENLYGIYLSSPDEAWSAIWRAVVIVEVLGEHRIEYFPPSPKEGDLVGGIGISGYLATGNISLASPAYLYFYDFDPKSVEGLTTVDLSQWCPNGKHKSLEGLGFAKRTIDGKTVFSVAYDRPMLIRIDQWQCVAVNIALRPVVKAVLMPDFVSELSHKVLDLRQGVQLTVTPSKADPTSRPAA
ncbi:MAG: hypothetical protein PHW33_03320 [Candidatus Portnoybacteria bacterium]|nr:hypothetical protein [Candidatus Portnoybacteria bacterium]MDD5437600.1 hypothetical protein [Patescibacteria group bacterium]